MGSRVRVIETIIIVNAFVFLLSSIVPQVMYTLFALRPSTIMHTPWTILTSMFMHSDFSHILFNMIGLFLFGIYLENIVGEKMFVRIYFLGGLFAGFSYLFTSLVLGLPPPHIPAVGASGAIFAVMGALVVLRPTLKIYMYFLFPMPLYVWAILYTVMAVPAMLTVSGTVAHNAHLGGLVAGLYFGMKLKKQQPVKPHSYTTQGYRFY